MLAFFRRRKWIWVILIAVFSVALIVTLIPMGTMSLDHVHFLTGGDVATVGDESVSAEEFRSMYDAYMHQLSEQTTLTPELMEVFGYDDQILDFLINQYVMIAEAKRLGLDASAEEIRERILNDPNLQENGAFIGLERYQTLLGANGMTVPEFEARVRNDIIMEKIGDLVTSATTVSDQEVESEYRYQNETVRLDYIVVDGPMFEPEIELTEVEQLEYFEKNQALYNVPEKRNARYVLVDTIKMQAEMEVPEEELRAYYRDHEAEYTLPARARAQHILFSTQGKTPEEVAPIRETAEDVMRRAQAGEDFAALAQQYSDDAVSAANGGDLGEFTPGQMVAEFEEAAFGLAAGTVSDLVETDFGIHIIRVNEQQSEQIRPFEEMRASIDSILRFQNAAEQADRVAQTIAVELVGDTDLESVAEKYGAELGETGLFAPGEGISGLAGTSTLESRIFTQELDQIGTAVAVANGHVIPVVIEIQEAHPASFEEVRIEVERELRREKAQELAQQTVAELTQRLEAGDLLTVIASALGLEVQTSEPLRRDGAIETFGSTSALDDQIFTLDIGATGEPVTVAGRTIAFAVNEKTPIDLEAMSEAFPDLHAQLLAQKKIQVFDGYSQDVKARMIRNGEIQTYEGNLIDVVQGFAVNHVH